MPIEVKTLTANEAGCFLDNHRGHYITRDVIQLAQEFGFIVGPFEQYAVEMYDNHHADAADTRVDYPHEALTELCDEAVAWLNSGQSQCVECHGTGKVWDATGACIPGVTQQQKLVICKACSGSGRGDRIAGQNFPPILPKGYYWGFEEGDFGLWKNENECARCGSELNDNGLCTDETCPFDSVPQDDERGWIGHPLHKEEE